jgi:AraC-like DNA-binding protein
MSIDAIAAECHDRGTVVPDRGTEVAQMTTVGTEMAEAESSSLLRSTLERLHLDGAIFFRTELSEPFAFVSRPAELADALHPGAQRVILFHVVARGSCWAATSDGQRYWATDGDVIVLPYGDEHTIGGVEAAESVPIGSLVDPPPWQHLPVIRHGGGGAPVELVCGYLHSHDPLFDPALRALPSLFVVRPPQGAAAAWVQASSNYALEAVAPSNLSPVSAHTRLPELVLIEVLRLHLATAPAAAHGWFAALSDPVLAPALSLLHGDPGRKWTVAELAAGVAVSRSMLDERFRRVLGRSPIRYLTEWRMHLAEDLLSTADLGVGAVARRVGYDSEEAFSRAFKRTHGRSPSHWRADRLGCS